MKIRGLLVFTLLLLTSIAGAKEGIFTCSKVPPAIQLRMSGNSCPEGSDVNFEDLRYLVVTYTNFKGHRAFGEIVCNKAIAEDLLYIFSELYEAGYPIRKIRLVDSYGGDDDISMADDNSSCFNYRRAVGQKRLSAHALGLAVDINPFENPYVKGTVVKPEAASSYKDRTLEHAIDHNDLCYKLFKSRGFVWGGDWKSAKDYQHFEKKQ